MSVVCWLGPPLRGTGGWSRSRRPRFSSPRRRSRIGPTPAPVGHLDRNIPVSFPKRTERVPVRHWQGVAGTRRLAGRGSRVAGRGVGSTSARPFLRRLEPPVPQNGTRRDRSPSSTVSYRSTSLQRAGPRTRMPRRSSSGTSGACMTRWHASRSHRRGTGFYDFGVVRMPRLLQELAEKSQMTAADRSE